MSLLREIQQGATDRTVRLADLLRKCLILAKRLQHEPLAKWAEQELNGYGEVDSLPSYRRREVNVVGDFENPAWRRTNVPIPSLSIEEGDRELLFSMCFMDGVAHYEALLASTEDRFTGPWPADYVALYATSIMEGYHLTGARRVLNRGTIEGMLDQVRNRILSFALEIEKENPEAGEAQPGGDPPVAPEKVQQSFVTHIYGGTNIVASGSQNVISDVKQVAAGDWKSLVEELKNLGVADTDIEALQTAIDEDWHGEQPGPAVKGWLGDITARITRGSLVLANNAAGSAVATLVLAHLGVV